jgi:Protein of unknown function (DUF2971)
MPTKTYLNFSEVEQDIIDNAPTIVYKYRTWTDTNHKNILINNQLWFSHPFDLNDPLDVRPEYSFDIAEIESLAFYENLLNSIPKEYENLDNEKKVEIAQKQWEKIKVDPTNHFNTNRKTLMTRKRFDLYGVFSTSSDCLNIPTWELYGDNHKGYSVGFNTLELARQLQCTTGIVTYCDKPFAYSFLGKHEELEILLYKKKAWSYEKEFRFLTLGIDIYSTRLRRVKPNVVAEVVLGCDILPNDEKEIIELIELLYPPDLPIFKTERNEQGQLLKNLIK